MPNKSLFGKWGAPWTVFLFFIFLIFLEGCGVKIYGNPIITGSVVFYSLYLLFPPPFGFHILFSREIRRLLRAAFQRMKYLSSESGVAHCSKLILSDQSQGTCQCQEPQRDETHSCTDTARHAAAWHSTRGCGISIQTAKGSQVNEFLCEKREAVRSFFGFIVKLKTSCGPPWMFHSSEFKLKACKVRFKNPEVIR